MKKQFIWSASSKHTGCFKMFCLGTCNRGNFRIFRGNFRIWRSFPNIRKCFRIFRKYRFCPKYSTFLTHFGIFLRSARLKLVFSTALNFNIFISCFIFRKYKDLIGFLVFLVYKWNFWKVLLWKWCKFRYFAFRNYSFGFRNCYFDFRKRPNFWILNFRNFRFSHVWISEFSTSPFPRLRSPLALKHILQIGLIWLTEDG